jgi:hypothetical protein
MKILFLTGWHAAPGGVKPMFLREHGHEVIAPVLDDGDFAFAIRTAQHAYDECQPDVVVGLSRGGAVAMNIDIGETPLVLTCPGWKRWGTAKPSARRRSSCIHEQTMWSSLFSQKNSSKTAACHQNH